MPFVCLGHLISSKCSHIMQTTLIYSVFVFCTHSVAGHVPPGDSVAMYFATKHAVTALTEGLRREIIKLKSKIRVTVSTVRPYNRTLL
jgi:short-subunit dehydrogenase